jgi:hypothetical protein
MRIQPGDGGEVEEVEEVAAIEPEFVHAASERATASTTVRRRLGLTSGRV